MVRLSVSFDGPHVYWDEGTPVPAGVRQIGAARVVPAGPDERRRWQAAAEAYIAESLAAEAERDAGRVAPKPPFWWSQRRRRHHEREIVAEAESRFVERQLAAAAAYLTHSGEVRARLDAEDRARHQEREAEIQRVYRAFYGWHHRHHGRRELAEAEQWRLTAGGVDLGGDSDAYALVTEDPIAFTPEARTAVETATGDPAEVWWAWLHGVARNLAARERAVARFRAAIAETVERLNRAGNPGAEPHLLDSSPSRPVYGWLIRFDRDPLRPRDLPMPPAEALRGGTFGVDVFMYGVHSERVLTPHGEFAWLSNSSNWYTRSQRDWTHDDPDRFADMALDPAVHARGPSGHRIHLEHRVSHLLPPDAYIPYIDAASATMAATVRALAP